MSGIACDVAPASQCAHIWLYRLVQRGQRQTSDAADRHKRQLKAGIAHREWSCHKKNQGCQGGGIEQLQATKEKSPEHDHRGHQRCPQDRSALLDDSDISAEHREREEYRPHSRNPQLPSNPIECKSEGTYVQASHNEYVKNARLLSTSTCRPADETPITQEHRSQHACHLRSARK